MYLLNLLFNIAPAATNKDEGRFLAIGRVGTDPPLEISRQWLRLEPHPNTTDPNGPTAFDPEVQTWTPVGGTDDAHVILFKTEPPGHICIRIAPVPGMIPALDPAATLSFFVLFGRPLKGKQRHASPFTFNDLPTGRTVAVFHQHPGITINTSKGWFFPLKPIAKSPGADPNVVHSYEFLVGAKLTNSGQVFTFGEDPEMDIGE